MLQRMRYYPEIVATLVTEDQVMKALDYAVENEVHSIRYRSLMENAEAAKIKGEDIKASMIVKRIADLRKVSRYYCGYAFRWTKQGRSKMAIDQSLLIDKEILLTLSN